MMNNCLTVWNLTSDVSLSKVLSALDPKRLKINYLSLLCLESCCCLALSDKPDDGRSISQNVAKNNMIQDMINSNTMNSTESAIPNIFKTENQVFLLKSMGSANQNFVILFLVIADNKNGKTLSFTSVGLKVHGTNNLNL